MTRENAKKLLPIIQTYAEGKEIQFRTNKSDEWEDYRQEYIFNFSLEYRIKPEKSWGPINPDGIYKMEWIGLN